MSVHSAARGGVPPPPRADISADTPTPMSGVRYGHYQMVAGMVGDAELLLERLSDLDEIPLPLLARFARAINRAEVAALARCKNIEEATE